MLIFYNKNSQKQKESSRNIEKKLGISLKTKNKKEELIVDLEGELVKSVTEKEFYLNDF
jgi:hypothetical protein